jgi:hypothetical protein
MAMRAQISPPLRIINTAGSRHMKKLISIAALAALTGCATPPPRPVAAPPDYSVASVVEGAVDVTRDDFKKQIRVVGPNVLRGYQTVMLRAIKMRDITVWQVYAADLYDGGGWRFYRDAYDRDGRALEFVSIDRKVLSCRSGCSYSEHMAVTLDRAYLERAAAGPGISVKLGTRTAGQGWEIGLPPGYIAGFLAAVDKIQ